MVQRTSANYAVGAFEGDELIGVANFVCCDDPAVAEAAIAVAQQDHLRGAATALLRHLVHAARRKRIRYFAADILAENDMMLRVLRDSGWPCTKRSDDSVLHVRIDLSARDGREAAGRRAC